MDADAAGRLVVAGSTYVHFRPTLTLDRYQPNGSIDTSFGVNGRAIVDLGDNFSYTQLVSVLGDGRILLSGASPQDALVVMLDPSGRLDTSFHGTGWLTINLAQNSHFDQVTAQVVRDNAITLLMRGSSMDVPLAIGRMSLDGSLVQGFGNGGIVTYTVDSLPAPFEATSRYVALEVGSGGDVIIPADTTDQNGAGLLRLDASGSPIGTGVRLENSQFAFRDVDAILRQPDGRLVLGGRLGGLNDGDFGVLRVLSPP
jgi:uncharacterized delta-60 repeat protein